MAKVSDKFGKAIDKATQQEIQEGINDDSWVSPLGLVTLIDSRTSEVGKTGEWSAILNKPTTLSSFTDDVGYALSSNLATVATTGSYNDLINKPDLSALNDIDVYGSLSLFPTTGVSDRVYIAEDTDFVYRWGGTSYIQLTDQTAVWGQISGTLSNQTDLQSALNLKADTSSLATVATTGSYNDLLDKPSGISLYEYVTVGQALVQNNYDIGSSNTFTLPDTPSTGTVIQVRRLFGFTPIVNAQGTNNMTFTDATTDTTLTIDVDFPVVFVWSGTTWEVK